MPPIRSIKSSASGCLRRIDSRTVSASTISFSHLSRKIASDIQQLDALTDRREGFAVDADAFEDSLLRFFRADPAFVGDGRPLKLFVDGEEMRNFLREVLRQITQVTVFIEIRIGGRDRQDFIVLLP